MRKKEIKIEKDEEIERGLKNSEKILKSLRPEGKDKYDELGCEFKNEDKCQEDADEEGVDLEKEEKEHYDNEEKGYDEEIEEV